MTDHKLDEEIKISPAENDDSIKIVAESEAEKSEENYEGKNIVLQNFELGDEVGSGTLGTVFRAKNIKTGSNFAIKRISHEYSRNANEIKSVLNSLKAATEIVNPHLCAFYSCGLHDERIYAVSDELCGQSLADAIASGRVFNTDRFIELFRQVCDALKSLHQRNIVHGDLKPSNIFLIDTGTGHDFVKITDFGIAGSFGEEQRHEFLRKSGGSYLSPEQCLGYELDSRSDIYSLGLIMYQVVTGKPFIEGQTPVHTVLKQLNVNCKKGLKESGVPDSIQQIIAKCLEKNRAQRYFSIADLDMDLELASAAQTDLTAFAAQWSDEKTKNTSKPPEDKVKFILSGVICAGVMGCLCLAGLNFINAQNYQNNMAPQLGPSPFVQSNFSPPPIVFANQNLNSDEAVREAERIIQDTSKLTSPYMGGGDAFNASTNTPSSMEPPLQVAETYYKEAISAFQKENPGRKDAEFKTKLAGLWTSLGELYTRATFTSDGNGIFDRKNAVTPTLGTNSMSAYTLYPSYLGLYPNSNLNADDKSAEINFEKAAKLLDNKFDDKSMNLLWDLTYVKFQLGKVDEAIDYQQKILDVLKSQKNPDLANMILSYDNLGRMHMWKSRYKEAIEEFKNARNLDKATYKIPGSSEWTDQVRSDLAYGFFLDGRISEAEKLARKNLALIESRPSEAQNTECQRLNMNILYKIFKLEHKDAEATAIELDAYKKNLAPW